MSTEHIPDGFTIVRTTDVFDHESVPAGLLKAHRVANDVWGRLVVHSGSVGFIFEDDPDAAVTVRAGESVVIPPGRRHHVEPADPSTFAVEFYRRLDESADGAASTGPA
ncbi:MAG: DUF1971 domain-containing protein [Acidimicrobiales bacterium]